MIRIQQRLFRGYFLVSSLSAAVLAATGVIAHAEPQATSTEFVLTTDALLSQFKEAIGPKGPMYSGAFNSYSIQLGAGEGFSFSASKSFKDKEGRLWVAELYAHTFNRESARMLEVNQRISPVAQPGFADLTISRSCKLRERDFSMSQQTLRASYSGECTVDPSWNPTGPGGAGGGQQNSYTFQLAAFPSRLSEELRACISAGATVTGQYEAAKRDLDTAKRDLQTAQSALKVAQYNLSTTQADLKNAKAARDKIVSVVTPYLNEILATLKEPNNFYIVLRKRATGVLDAVVGAQS